ncbi:hypothetical protein D3C86_1525340 [compost metagenome]
MIIVKADQLADQRRANHKGHRSPQTHAPVVHRYLFLPGVRKGIRQRNQRREEEVKADHHHHQPGKLLADPEACKEHQREQRKNAHGFNQQRGIADARRNQQAAEESRHQACAQQYADGFRSQADTFEPHAPERQKDTVAKKVGKIAERQPARGMQTHESLPFWRR